MSDDFMSESLCTERMEPLSKSVTKVQRLPNISDWNDSNAVLRDFIKIFFTKRSAVFRMKKHLPPRKRVSVLTPEDILLVYETNCTGYSFNIRTALRLKTSCYGHTPDSFEKSYTVNFKYNFGYVSLVLVNNQIPVWREAFYAIFEGEPFNGNLVTGISMYTARDDDIDETLLTNRSKFDYTESVISLKSARGSTDLSPSQENVTVDPTQAENTENTSLKVISNRSSTCLPLTIRSTLSQASVVSRHQDSISMDHNNNSQHQISVRQGSLAVSYLAKKFESRLGLGRKVDKSDNKKSQKHESSPLEVLFPSIPERKQHEDEKEDVI